MDNELIEITPDRCEQAFRDHLQKARLELAELTLATGLDTFIAFYQSHPADEEELDLQADLLALRWGQYDRSCTPETFPVNLTRQIVINDSCDDDEIYCLSLTFHYGADADTKTNGTRSVWFKGEEDSLEDWRDNIRKTDIFRHFAAAAPLTVVLEWVEL